MSRAVSSTDASGCSEVTDIPRSDSARAQGRSILNVPEVDRSFTSSRSTRADDADLWQSLRADNRIDNALENADGGTIHRPSMG